MKSLVLPAAAAAVVLLCSAAVQATDRQPAPGSRTGIFQPLTPCPAGKVMKVVYDSKGVPVGTVCV